MTTHPVRCHFLFPATKSGKPVKLKVIEDMTESGFNVQVPIELLCVFYHIVKVWLSFSA